MLAHLTVAEVETLAYFKHHLETSVCNWQACTETIDGFNEYQFTC